MSIVVVQFPYAIVHSSECFCVTKNILYIYFITYYCWKIESKEKSLLSYACWSDFFFKKIKFLSREVEEKVLKEKRTTKFSIYNLYFLQNEISSDSCPLCPSQAVFKYSFFMEFTQFQNSIASCRVKM